MPFPLVPLTPSSAVRSSSSISRSRLADRARLGVCRRRVGEAGLDLEVSLIEGWSMLSLRWQRASAATCCFDAQHRLVGGGVVFLLWCYGFVRIQDYRPRPA
jgi:hypothetical protein